MRKNIVCKVTQAMCKLILACEMQFNNSIKLHEICKRKNINIKTKIKYNYITFLLKYSILANELSYIRPLTSIHKFLNLCSNFRSDRSTLLVAHTQPCIKLACKKVCSRGSWRVRGGFLSFELPSTCGVNMCNA